MKKNKRFASLLMASSLVIGVLSGCNNDSTATEKNESATTIEFWSSPNPTQEAYWKEVAEAFEAEHEDIKVNVSPMKETPTSEASIQAAIAGGSAPTISENINRGFAAQLAESQALTPLDELPGFDEIISGRNMTETIKTWQFSDGKQYVLPMYSNAMLFAWRIDILKELGYDAPPKTYSEMIEVAKKLKETHSDKYVWAKPDLADPTAWKRWFDFFMLYNAASDGNNFIEGSEFVADDKAGEEVLDLLATLQKEDALMTEEVTDPFETGFSIFTDLGPWTFTTWNEKFPELKYNENYTLSLPPVPDNMDPANSKTFADTKGLVIYAQATEEEKEAAMTFINWVFSNPENDVKWLETTNLPPARDDLGTNESFKAFFESTPQLQPYADAVSAAIPPIDNANFNELQEQIGIHAVNPVVKGETTPEDGWKAMKEAIEGALKE